ncbi:hypothetical protein AO1008_00370 [Aspergillus oryzae 100-8]|uniref:Uncharacterized protein n=1 Tax=Aspergillus oryzae (strain 3.042) TaxID=1160506 RepID=I8TMN8_ASPO3|nr:hypothetical protein Ao3042_09138 [Aspergillus oryzae 3.042]KDE85008.1 hypothetical protein AO1008_00370 [Aspergillus oryzae 100-8]|eukprot:EIT75183.1 hypothetical protein Ao3042_09138 [Aspergillus oryzae 3.042]
MLVCSVARIHQIQDSAEVAPQAFQRDRTQTDDLKIDYSFAQPASPQSLTYPNKLIYRDQECASPARKTKPATSTASRAHPSTSPSWSSETQPDKPSSPTTKSRPDYPDPSSTDPQSSPSSSPTAQAPSPPSHTPPQPDDAAETPPPAAGYKAPRTHLASPRPHAPDPSSWHTHPETPGWKPPSSVHFPLAQVALRLRLWMRR